MTNFDQADKYYIVSHPKSGRTWLAVVLGKLFELEFGVPSGVFLEFKDGTSRLTNDRKLPDVRFTHGNSKEIVKTSNIEAFHGANVIFLIRDPRDIQVSYYFQITKRRKAFQGDLSSFIRNEDYGIRKIVKYHNLWYQERNTLASFQMIRYEDMHRDCCEVIRKVVQCLQLPVQEENIARAVEWGRFENMKEMELESAFDSHSMSPANIHDPESYKVRRGQIGGHADYLSPLDLQYIEQEIQTGLDDIYSFYKKPWGVSP